LFLTLIAVVTCPYSPYSQEIARDGVNRIIWMLAMIKVCLCDFSEEDGNECVILELRDDPEFAAAYLKEALEDTENPGGLLVALRRIAEARGGMAKVAKAAGIERESLYRALSARGNPRLSTLIAVTKAVRLKLTVESAR
jgi:probable addiction module antidote protein